MNSVPRVAALIVSTLALVGTPAMTGAGASTASTAQRSGALHIEASWDWRGAPGVSGAEFGLPVATGDVNCDGYQDLIVGADEYTVTDTYQGAVYVYDGSATGLARSPSWFEAGAQGYEYFGSALESADVNSDGCADLIDGSPGEWTSGAGEVFVYNGSHTGLSTNPSWTKKGPLNYGYALATLGADLIVGTPTKSRVWLYRGGTPQGLQNTAAWSYVGLAGSGVGFSVAGIPGSLPEVAVGAPYWNQERGEAVVLRASNGTRQFRVRANTPEEFLGWAVAGGDVNGDGSGDVLIGGPSEQVDVTPHVYLFEGNSTGIHGPAVWRSSWTDVSEYGYSLALIDLNGDSYADVVIGAPGESGYRGWVFAYLGSSSGPHVNPDWDAEGGRTGIWLGISVAAGWFDNHCCRRSIAAGAFGYPGGIEPPYDGAAYAYYHVP
jgi:hypothetical protein